MSDRVAETRAAALDWYAANGRDLAFRHTTDPWAILVSEVMAQQTQASRAAEAWTIFMAKFPTPESLAAASPAAVIRAWRGLGYNRRALALRDAAIDIVEDHAGRVPDDLDALQLLPGIGPVHGPGRPRHRIRSSGRGPRRQHPARHRPCIHGSRWAGVGAARVPGSRRPAGAGRRSGRVDARTHGHRCRVLPAARSALYELSARGDVQLRGATSAALRAGAIGGRDLPAFSSSTGPPVRVDDALAAWPDRGPPARRSG